MTISGLLRGIAVMMLIVAVCGAALALWTTNRAEFFNERITLAHRSYEAHLRLNSNTYQLFKQYADAMLIGDLDKGAGERALIAAIRSDIGEIRALIGREIELVGDEEIEELELLARIEGQIEDLIERFEIVLLDPVSDRFSRNWSELSVILEDQIDRDFHSMIEAALEEELAEVEETRAAAERHLTIASRLAALLVLIAVSITGLSLVKYRTRIAGPLRQLMRGVGELAEGRFDRRIGLQGRTEIVEIANVMDTMAAMVEARTKSLTTQNAELEDAVKGRTAELEALVAEIRDAEDARRQMLADVSHELRTPLTIIQGESDVALRGGDKTPEEYREALRRTRETARHTNLLVNDLLFVAREEMGQARLALERVDLRALLDDAVELFGPDIPVLSDLDAAVVSLDVARVRQCVAALIQNARRYGGPEIVARLLRTPTGYRIMIEDDGPGLSDAEKGKAFDRFFRGSNAAERYEDGAGLGLPVVRAIAEAHGGSATLRDRDGGGLVSVLDLPASAPLQVVS